MKRLIALISISVALAIGVTGCAHDRLRSSRAQSAATVAVVVGVLVLAASYNCGDCSIGGHQAAARP